MNPVGLPETLPFQVEYDARRRLLRQVASNALLETLKYAYDLGQSFGTPLSESGLGRAYAQDFIDFIEHHCSVPGLCLEIGAGTGYLTSQLAARGWMTVGLEPGQGYREYWTRNRANVIAERFPSQSATGPFSLITSYGVLEHLSDPVASLQMMRDHLSPQGKVVLSVPDCSAEVVAGDPAILVHEHLSYFTRESLQSALESAGFHAKVIRSTFARCLYAVGIRCDDGCEAIERPDDPVLMSYPERAAAVIMRLREDLTAIASKGTLGVYAATRGLALLDPGSSYRFFDDDPAWRGYFIPPFNAPIEGRDTLFADPVDTLVILSRTFGHAIHQSLRESGYVGSVLLLDDLG